MVKRILLMAFILLFFGNKIYCVTPEHPSAIKIQNFFCVIAHSPMQAVSQFVLFPDDAERGYSLSDIWAKVPDPGFLTCSRLHPTMYLYLFCRENRNRIIQMERICTANQKEIAAFTYPLQAEDIIPMCEYCKFFM